ncbi:transmembrane protease serine 9-like [Venturia canescens]|uniref:transmembrane protease serine 9-like n=1 Tax=Venturia canescens TaxID=32260 RepID=UPI001C9BD753|nr:transmembrane protease serine 9-like [Venturia canescens]
MMFHYVLAALLVAQGCLAHAGYRIIDGDESPPHQFPYMVSVVWGLPPVFSYRHMCGGTILSEKWILTAAHCVEKSPWIGKLGVYAGKHIINQREDGQQFSTVGLKVLHWKYPEGNGEHDIAMLKLVTPLQFGPYIKAAKLPRGDRIPSGTSVLAGWGSVSKGWLPKYPAILQTATVPIIDNDRCYSALHELSGDYRLFKTQLCTGPLYGSVSACHGDGGGPLVQYDENAIAELVGIVSWSKYPCGSGAPTIYTRVSAYVEWIKNKLLDTMNAKFLFAFCTVLATAVSQRIGFNLPTLGLGRIVGGEDARKNEFPHQVSLQWGIPPLVKYQHFCGGSIIDSQWVLTAGHCAEAVPWIGSFVIKAGKHNVKVSEADEQVISVTKKIVHEKYEGDVGPYDLALLKLKSPLVLSNAVKVISIPKNVTVPSGNSTLSGWGSISADGKELPAILQKAVLPLIDLKTCNATLEELVGPSPLHETNICTRSLNEQSACSGDSGGPLIKNNTSGNAELIGVVSWGVLPCGADAAPSVYVDVSQFGDWINATTSGFISDHWYKNTGGRSKESLNRVAMSPNLVVVFSTILVAVVQAADPFFGFNVPKLGFNSGRIVGGEDAEPGEFPYQVSLQWSQSSSQEGRHFCGGCILSENYIVTAGHCALAVPSYGSFVVKAGKHFITRAEPEEQVVEVEKSVVHPEYVGYVAPYDIAVLKLKTPLKFNSAVQPIELPKQGEIFEGKSHLSGWGSVAGNGQEMPTVLQKVVLPILNFEPCKKAFDTIVGSSHPLSPKNICTSGENGRSACSGDSGGPLVFKTDYQTTLIGLVSWGIMPCGQIHAPSVYTQVSDFVDWINQETSINWSEPTQFFANRRRTMTSKLLLIICALVATINAVEPQFGNNVPRLSLGFGRIVGGEDAQEGEFPHQVSLQWGVPPLIRYKHFCGGSIISSRWIVTAGHCVLAIPSFGSFKVKAGKYNIKKTESDEQGALVQLKIVHESYKGNVAPYDIALLKLKTPLALNEAVKAISLPEMGVEPSGSSILSGWGSISGSGLKMPRILQKAVLPIIDYETCKASLEALTGPSPLHETNVCTGSTSGQSACSGDSGGPLIVKKSSGAVELIGVVSWGLMPCGSQNAPSVYTGVSKFVDWIRTNMKKNA